MIAAKKNRVELVPTVVRITPALRPFRQFGCPSRLRGTSIQIASIRALLAASILTCSVLHAGCCFIPSSPGDGASSPPAIPTPGHADFEALGRQLQEGRHHGEGPGAEAMAIAIRGALEPRDGAAVRVVELPPGGPRRRVVALVRLDDDAQEGLADLSEARRQEYLEQILEILDAGFNTGADDVGVGIRGSFFYGAVVTRRVGEPPQFSTGMMVDTRALEELCAAPAAPVTTVAAPAPPSTPAP